MAAWTAPEPLANPAREHKGIRMRARLAVIATALLLAVAFATPVSAISNGTPDTNNDYPYVGIVLTPMEGGGFWLCSGAALSPTKVLTAAHCVGDGTTDASVSFEKSAPHKVVAGTFHGHPEWCIGCGPGLPGFDRHDVAVIILDQPLSLPEYADLPSQGQVADLRTGTRVDIVGYGLRREKYRGKPQLVGDADYTRFYAPTKLIKSKKRSEFIKLSANTAKDKGGVCFGDSGGPDLLGGTKTVLAVNSYGPNGNCAGVSYSNRIDTKIMLDFIIRTK